MIRPSRERIRVERVQRERARQEEERLNAAVYDALRPDTSLLEDAEDCDDVVAAARDAASIIATHVEYTDRYPMAYRNAMRRIDP